MEEGYLSHLGSLPENGREATKIVLTLVLDKIQPKLVQIRNNMQSEGDEDVYMRIQDMYSLCASQISKCLVNLFEIFRLEISHQTALQESRQYSLERLSWCLDRLSSIEKHLERESSSCERNDSADDSMNVTVMYFVNWIDHTFDVLSKLAKLIYKNDYKESEMLLKQWKFDMVECVSELHVSIDELLLSAMTLCKYCLSSDQHVVKARCQVVLRETKELLSELIEGDLSSTVKATPTALKLPIMPSNVNVLIDVLKDVLYSLETNTNTALLSLLVHCFSQNKSPVDALKDHFTSDNKGTCPCLIKSDGEVTEDCSFVKEFDLHNERLLQIGNFAVSCSSDQNRILSLRSGLASLEALDPHLVPALMMSPETVHTGLLTNSWRREVQDIRDNVFLIVDPAAFAEKSKQMMHERLVNILKENKYDNGEVCAAINIGCVVHDLFSVYDKCEPEALAHHDKLIPLLADLKKVQKECKIVSNLLCSIDDFVYDIRMPENKDVFIDQLIKRLKLLYTLVTRINNLLHPKENDDQLFAYDCEEPVYKNTTHTVCKNADTYVHSPKKINVSRSIFARTNVRSSTRNVPLSKLTKHLKTKIGEELSFSVQLDRLFNSSKEDPNSEHCPKNLGNIRESTVLHNFSPMKNRSSLRKAVLNRHCKSVGNKDVKAKINLTYDKESIMDETMSLQITDILNQMNDMTSLICTRKSQRPIRTQNKNTTNTSSTKNVLSLTINNQDTATKHIWNIPVNSSTVDMCLDDSAGTSTFSQQSTVNTLERIHDLDLVESKVNSLKSQLETSL